MVRINFHLMSLVRGWSQNNFYFPQPRGVSGDFHLPWNAVTRIDFGWFNSRALLVVSFVFCRWLFPLQFRPLRTNSRIFGIWAHGTPRLFITWASKFSFRFLPSIVPDKDVFNWKMTIDVCTSDWWSEAEKKKKMRQKAANSKLSTTEREREICTIRKTEI